MLSSVLVGSVLKIDYCYDHISCPGGWLRKKKKSCTLNKAMPSGICYFTDRAIARYLHTLQLTVHWLTDWEKVMLDRDLFSISHCLYFISHLNKAHLNMVLTFSCMISETSSSYSNVSYVSTFFYPGKRWYGKMFALSLLLLFGIFVQKLFETNPNFRYFG